MHVLTLVLVLLVAGPGADGVPPASGAEIRALIRDLGSDSWEARERARKSLHLLGEAARPHLEAALGDPDLEVRRAVAKLLRQTTGPVVPDLARLLRGRDDDFPRSDAFAEILAKGEAAIPLLLDAIRQENDRHPQYDYYTVRNAFLVLAELARTGVLEGDRIAEVIALLDTDNTNVVSLVRPVLQHLGGEALGPMLEARWKTDPAPRLRARVLEVIYNVDRTRGQALLAPALEDEDAGIRLVAAQLLSRGQATPEILTTLIGVMADPDPRVRAAVVQGLFRYASERKARAAVRIALRDPDDEVRRNALYTASNMFRQHPDPTLLPNVRSFLDETDPDVVRAAAQLLGNAEDRDATPQLLALLRRPDSTLRQQIVLSVIMALGQIRDPSARVPLEAFARDPAVKRESRYRSARVYAVQAVLRIAGEEAIPLLEETLGEMEDQFAPQILLQTLLEVPGSRRRAIFLAYLDSEDRMTVARAAQGLGQVGAVDTAPRLAALLSRDDSYLRQNVLEALGALASPEAAPALLEFLASLVGESGDTPPANTYHVRLAIEALGAAAHRPAQEILIRLVKARGRHTLEAAEALSLIGGDEARKALEELRAEQGEGRDARQVAIALARLGDRAPLEEIHRQDLAAIETDRSDGRALGNAADSAIRLGDSAAALDLSAKRIALDETDADARYDRACILTLCGKTAEALATLEAARVRGYRNTRQALRDPDLRGLHGEAEFRRIIAAMNRS